MAITTKQGYISRVKRNMKNLGIYKKEYDEIIKIFGGMLYQYMVFETQFAENGYKIEEEYTNKAGATNMRKTPLYTAMESLRKDIATYSDKLGLNPKTLDAITVEHHVESKLSGAFKNINI